MPSLAQLDGIADVDHLDHILPANKGHVRTAALLWSSWVVRAALAPLRALDPRYMTALYNETG